MSTGRWEIRLVSCAEMKLDTPIVVVGDDGEDELVYDVVASRTYFTNDNTTHRRLYQSDEFTVRDGVVPPAAPAPAPAPAPAKAQTRSTSEGDE